MTGHSFEQQHKVGRVIPNALGLGGVNLAGCGKPALPFEPTNGGLLIA